VHARTDSSRVRASKLTTSEINISAVKNVTPAASSARVSRRPFCNVNDVTYALDIDPHSKNRKSVPGRALTEPLYC
jgi:hypothetical protein